MLALPKLPLKTRRIICKTVGKYLMNKSKNNTKSSYFSILILGIILIILELIASYLSYENYGGLYPGFILLLIMLNVIPLIFLIQKKNLLSLVLMLSIAILIVPNQIIHSKKLSLLKIEGANIVNYVYMNKLKEGEFPSDLSDYNFRYPELKDNFGYQDLTKEKKEDFIVRYNVGSKTTSFFYFHSYGPYWNYEYD